MFGLAIFSACVLAAPLPAQTGRITGTVTDSATAQPVAAADVIVVGTSHRTKTGSDGTFTLTDVPAGVHVVDARRIGYTALRRPGVQVPAGGSVTVDFRLPPSLFRVQEVVVTGVLVSRYCSGGRRVWRRSWRIGSATRRRRLVFANRHINPHGSCQLPVAGSKFSDQ